jgi:HEAT repeat protein
MNLLLIGAAVSLCLAVMMWIALVLARWLRHRASVRRRRRQPTARLALAEFCADGDAARLGATLGKLPADDVIAVVGRALPLLSRRDRAAVGAALADGGMARVILRRFARCDENRRILACELLGAIGGKDAAAGLTGALKDRAATVRIAAAIALVELGQAPPVADLLAMLGRGARGSSRLVYLLEKLVPDCQAEMVRLVTGPGAEPRLRISALQALELAAAPTHRALILRLGGEPCPHVAVAVARALARERGAETGAVLAAMMTHAAPAVRREAAAAAGSAGFLAARPALVRLTGDPDPSVAAAAARSMWLLRRQPAHRDPILAPGEAA